MNSTDARQLRFAALAAILVAPAAIFFFAAIGRSLQPVTHEPARTLEAIVTWFGALPGASLLALLVMLPCIGLILAASMVRKTWSSDEGTRADVAAFVRAGMRVVRRPAFVLSILVLAFGALYFAAVAVHAIAG